MTRPTATTLNRRQFLQLSGSATALLALSGCVAAPPTSAPVANPAAGADTPQRGGLVRIAISDDVTTFDPMRGLNNLDLFLAPQLYDTLIEFNNTPDGIDLQPRLAESWTISEDGLTYTFHLRQGVRFQHGTPFTAADVKHSLDYLLDPATASFLAANLPPLAAIDVVDEQTITVTLTEPTATLLAALALIYIVPHDRSGEQLAAEATGTGPFRVGDRSPGERLVLQRNPEYWNPELPYLDEVHWLVIPDPTTQAAALSSDTLDLMFPAPLGVLPVLENTPDVTVLEGPPNQYATYVMRVDREPFTDVRVRQAFKHALDRTALQKTILQGRGAIGNDQLLTPGTIFWADVAPLAYDVERAKALLAEAGYPDGLTVELVVAELGPNVVDMAVVMQEMVKAAGITLTLQRAPADTYWQNVWAQVPFFASFAGASNEPDFALSIFFLSTAIFNESGWADPTLDELIFQGRRTADLAERKAIYAQAQALISAQGAVLIPLFQSFLWGVRTTVRGLTPENGLRAQYLWLASGAVRQ